MAHTSEFKRCSCQTQWASREKFIRDPDILPIGITFLPNQDSLRAYYFFNHATCKTTLVVDSEEFADLIDEPVPEEIKAGGKECKGHCTKKEDLEMCDVECRNAPFRRFFVEHILNRKI